MKTYFFTIKIQHFRTFKEIATRTGIVFAENQEIAESKIWTKYGGNNASKLCVWEVLGEIESYCVYYK